MFGRVDLCDFVLEHPTISRFHAGMYMVLSILKSLYLALVSDYEIRKAAKRLHFFGVQATWIYTEQHTKTPANISLGNRFSRQSIKDSSVTPSPKAIGLKFEDHMLQLWSWINFSLSNAFLDLSLQTIYVDKKHTYFKYAWQWFQRQGFDPWSDWTKIRRAAKCTFCWIANNIIAIFIMYVSWPCFPFWVWKMKSATKIVICNENRFDTYNAICKQVILLELDWLVECLLGF